MIQLDRYDRVEAFLERAGSFLTEREAEHNLILGICSVLKHTPEAFDAPPYLATVHDGERLAMGAIRTPPHNVVLSMCDRFDAIDPLADDAIAAYPDLPGVLGPREAARRFAERVSHRTGRPQRLSMRERIFRLSRVISPRPTSGSWRVANERDRDVLRTWLVAFQREAIPDAPGIPDLEAALTRWIERTGRSIYLWEDGGRPVSMVGAGAETPSGVRIGPVYTPSGLRGRGYASALTAAVSHDQLERGRSFCYLFTDLANPTSNKIYTAVGYEPVVDVDQYRFG